MKSNSYAATAPGGNGYTQLLPNNDDIQARALLFLASAIATFAVDSISASSMRETGPTKRHSVVMAGFPASGAQ